MVELVSKDTFVDQISILTDGTLVVTLSNQNKFMYDTAAKCWREVPGSVQLQSSDPHRPIVNNGQGQDLSTKAPITVKGVDLQSLVKELENER